MTRLNGMHLAELTPPSRAWFAALPLALLLLPRGVDERPPPIVERPPEVDGAFPSPPCDDPYTGVWVARSYRGEHGDWHEYTLAIERDGNALRGELALVEWPGGDIDGRFGDCPDGTPMIGRYEHIPVTIAVHGGEIRLDAGRSPSHRASTCNPLGEYSPDHFVGTLECRGTIEAVNSDDAGYAHDRPYEFIRLLCGS